MAIRVGLIPVAIMRSNRYYRGLGSQSTGDYAISPPPEIFPDLVAFISDEQQRLAELKKARSRGQ